MNVIYDFGCHNGQDIPYYLKKADIVVAVEANPLLCNEIERSFDAEIKSGKLALENCIINVDSSIRRSPFYIHKANDLLSQLPAPNAHDLHNFECVILPTLSPVEIIKKHGPPHYIKIDIEHYDQDVLRHLVGNSIFSPFISAESHSIEVFCLLAGSGRYNAFKLVDGRSVSKFYQNAQIITDRGTEHFEFPCHSAGPFGDDVKGEWMSAIDLMRVLAFEGFGWKDIHATYLAEAPKPNLRLRSLFRKALFHNFSVLMRSVLNLYPASRRR